MVSKISWTHLRHRCCLSQIGVVCCLFGCTWSYGFAIHWACLFSLALCVWLFVFVARVVWRVFSPFPSLSPPTLAYFCWLLSPGCSLGPRHRSLWLPSPSDLLGGDWGRARGRQPPTQPKLSIIHCIHLLTTPVTVTISTHHVTCMVTALRAMPS